MQRAQQSFNAVKTVKRRKNIWWKTAKHRKNIWWKTAKHRKTFGGKRQNYYLRHKFQDYDREQNPIQKKNV